MDECEREDTEEILEFLQRLSKSIPMSLCLSSRPASSLQKFASNLFKLEHVINLGDHSREDEIVSFIDAEIHRRKGSRNIPPDLEELIKKQLIAGAQGMSVFRVHSAFYMGEVVSICCPVEIGISGLHNNTTPTTQHTHNRNRPKPMLST